MPIDCLEHGPHEGADLLGAAGTCDVAHLRGQLGGRQDAGAHGVFEVVAHVCDPIGPRHDLTLGREGRRTAPRVVAHAVERLETEVERRQRDVGAVDRVVVPRVGKEWRERLLRCVPGGAVTAVVSEGDRLGERKVEPDRAGDAGRDLRHLDRMRQPGAEVVVFRRDEHLALAGKAPPRPRVLHPVEITLEAEPVRVGLLGFCAVAGAERPGRAGREREIERGLALVPAPQATADEPADIGVRALHHHVGIGGERSSGDLLVHAPTVPVGYDTEIRVFVQSGPL